MIYINKPPDILMMEETCDNDIHANPENWEKLFNNNCNKCGVTPCYAGDATVIAMSNSRDENQRKVEENLRKMGRFVNNNRLTMNMAKTTLVESMIKQK